MKFTDARRASSSALDLDARRRRRGPVLRVEVTDTGAGIAPEVRSRLFESFSQGDSLDDARVRRHRAGPGHQPADRRRRSAARSASRASPGHGSTFWFTAAVRRGARRAASAAAVAGRSRVGPAGPRRRRQRDATGSSLEEQLAAWSMLGDLGDVAASTASCSSTRPTAAAARSTSSLLDDPMPGADGLQFARMIRSDDALRGAYASCSLRARATARRGDADGGRRRRVADGARHARPRSSTPWPTCVGSQRLGEPTSLRPRAPTAGRRRPPRHGSSSSRTTRSTSSSRQGCSRASATPSTRRERRRGASTAVPGRSALRRGADGLPDARRWTATTPPARSGPREARGAPRCPSSR